MKKKATIRDVAKHAGVSISTVSRFLNRSGNVEEENGQRILQAVKEINYVPSVAASSLKSHKSRIILLVVPDISNPFYSVMAQTVQRLVGLKDYAMVLYNTNEQPEEELASIHLARQLYAGGILFATVDTRSRVTRALEESGISVVGLNAYTSSPFDAVHVSHIGGTYLTTRHLIELGHRKIAFAGGLAGSMIGKNRRNGYETALREEGLQIEENYIFEMGFSQANGYKAGCYFSALAEMPTAICCANDLLALGVMDALNERNYSIPGDISVTGMDDIPYARTASPRLTTATNDSAAFASEGVRLLFERIKDGYTGEPRVIEIAHELVIRASTGKPKHVG